MAVRLWIVKRKGGTSLRAAASDLATLLENRDAKARTHQAQVADQQDLEVICKSRSLDNAISKGVNSDPFH
jgi:hypothetical protein